MTRWYDMAFTRKVFDAVLDERLMQKGVAMDLDQKTEEEMPTRRAFREMLRFCEWCVPRDVEKLVKRYGDAVLAQLAERDSEKYLLVENESWWLKGLWLCRRCE